jgi:deferrochelatase/peroxidase EfeB
MPTRDNPLPMLDGPFQAGITDPQWSVSPPTSITSPEERDRYLLERAGRIDPQEFLTVLTADLAISSRRELTDVLTILSSFARVQMTRRPDKTHIPILRRIPDTWRVTVTIGFGSSLFMTTTGDDRFGLYRHRPKWLRPMPPYVGDVFEPSKSATDLIFLIASDHSYVNVSIARALCEGNWGNIGSKERRLIVKSLDQGFARPDRREFLRFDDGIDNLSNLHDEELNRFVYVHTHDGEPASAENGTYLVWRKIRENLPLWEVFSETEQEKMIGRKKETGAPLSRVTIGHGGMTPVYPNHTDVRDGPLTAHIRKVQPRRAGEDLFKIADLDRRFLRRNYPYFEGLETTGRISCGLLFLAFMRDLRKQFEWSAQMWQTNPDFPLPGTGIDALYGRGVLSNVRGGYYFCPASLGRSETDFVGMNMFQ